MTSSFYVLLLFLPAAASLFWMLLNCLVARRTTTYHLVQFLSLDLFLFFTADAFYAVPGVSPEVLVYTHLVAVFSAPCVVPLVWMYFHRMRHEQPFKIVHYLWILIPVALTFSAVSLTDTIGVERLASFVADTNANGSSVVRNYRGTAFQHYFFWTHWIFRIAVSAELLSTVIYIVSYVVREKVRFRNLFAYFRDDEPIKVPELLVFSLIIPALFVISKVILPKHFLDTHLWVSIIQATVVTLGFFFFQFCTWFGEKATITRSRVAQVMMYNFNPSVKGQIVESMMEDLLEDAEQEALLRLREKIGENIIPEEIGAKASTGMKELLFGSVAGSWDDNLLSRFQTLMLNEQLFLKPSLSLQDVAEKLHTNKTYISKLVNNTYNLGFPELLNTLRIDYAEQYIRNHPDAKQEEIARACGFLSASSFNNIFKKITGMTPKMWLLSIDNKRK